VPATTTAPPRRTKAERSAATQALLLDATIDCLVELGWSGTSTTEVVRRAGVSRGAQVHHFPSKEDLVLAAVERLHERRLDEFRTAFQNLPASERTPGTAFDLLRSMCDRPTFAAWLELAVAARTQSALQERWNDTNERFWDATLALHSELYAETAADPAFNRMALRFALSLADGMAMGRLGGADPAELDTVADAFKQLVTPFFPSTHSTSEGATL
jgi:AcrR family transcriptional regulator